MSFTKGEQNSATVIRSHSALRDAALKSCEAFLGRRGCVDLRRCLTRVCSRRRSVSAEVPRLKRRRYSRSTAQR